MTKTTKNIHTEEDHIKATALRLKAKHGKVFVIQVDVDKDDTAVAYMKEPGRDIVDYFISNVENSPMGATTTLYNDCLLMPESDKRFIDDINILLSSIPSLTKVFAVKKSTLTIY